jgi:ubiquinone/menaquinone biosynthesis C-methylase UbiE
MFAFAQAPHTHQHRFDDAARWAQVFDDPKRDAWQKPHEVITALDLKPDAIVADVGAGTGYFAVRFARMLPQGRIYAADIEPAMVQHLAERAQQEGLKNLIALRATADEPRLPEKADVVVFVDVYHHVAERVPYLRRLKNSLAPGGRIAVIDFRLQSMLGPPRAARIAPEQVKREFSEAGFDLIREHDFLPNQYFLTFAPLVQ